MEKRIEGMDLNLITALYWLLMERNVTAAAGRLGLSQPATSRALGRLRDVYSDPILVKSGREMLLTPLAETLLPLVTRAVTHLRSVISITEGFSPLAATGTFRVGCKDNIGMRVVSAWARSVKPYAPYLTLDIVNLEVSNARDLVSGKLDLVIMPITPADLPPSVDLSRFVIKPVFTDEWVTCLREGHPDAGKAMTLKRFAAYDHILVNPEGGETGRVDEFLSERGLSRHIAYRSASFLLALPILLGTDCVLTTPTSLVGCGIPGVKVFESPLHLTPLSYNAGWHPNWTTDARHKWVRSRLLTTLAENDPQCLCHFDMPTRLDDMVAAQ